MSLIDKIRKARESSVTVEGHTYTIRRPTDMEMAEHMASGGLAVKDLMSRFVTGWDVTELDLIPGGNPTPAKFSAELFDEWIADRPDDWMPLATAIKDAYLAHANKRDDEVKN